MTRDLFDQREYARAFDLRNRSFDPEPIAQPAPVYGPRCSCGNVLTISDSGPRCRQCVLEGRIPGGLRVGRPL